MKLKFTTTALFDVGLVIKGIDSVLEVIGGILLLSPFKVGGFIEVMAQHSKHDYIARWLNKLAGGVEAATIATAIYLMIHGAAKAILILAAFKKKVWGYIGLMAVLLIFACIEFLRYLEVHRPALLVFSIFDALLVLLIANEYRVRYGQLQKAR